MLNNLQKEMDVRRVKVKEIADLLGIKSPAVSKRIYGSVAMKQDEKEKIAAFLGISDLDYLFLDSGTITEKKKYKKTVFSTRFSEALERDGRTQKEIAELLGVNERTISDWKNGKQSTTIETIKKISEILDASVSYLTGESDFYPSSVNYHDASIDEYTKKTYAVNNAVLEYLKHINYDVDKLLEIKDTKIAEHFAIALKKYKKEEELAEHLETEINDYVEKLAEKQGVDISGKRSCYDNDLTEEQEGFFRSLELDSYYTSKMDELMDAEEDYHLKITKETDRLTEQSNRIGRFLFDLPSKIQGLLKELDDIIEEYNIFDAHNRSIETALLRKSSSERSLFDLERLYSSVEKLDEESLSKALEKNSSPDRSIHALHLNGYYLSFFDYTFTDYSKESILKYLESKMKSYKELIIYYQNMYETLSEEEGE